LFVRAVPDYEIIASVRRIRYEVQDDSAAPADQARIDHRHLPPCPRAGDRVGRSIGLDRVSGPIDPITMRPSAWSIGPLPKIPTLSVVIDTEPGVLVIDSAYDVVLSLRYTFPGFSVSFDYVERAPGQQAGNRIEIGCVNIAPDAGRFERDGASAAE